jgi:hypothetical protein
LSFYKSLYVSLYLPREGLEEVATPVIVNQRSLKTRGDHASPTEAEME